MAWLPEFREVRVTSRGVRLTEHGKLVAVNTRSDFVAPDISPVSTHQLELEKGQVGWTDFDKRVETLTSDRRERQLAAQRLREATVGETVIRAPRPKTVLVRSAGPSASYRNAQVAAQKLVERNRREASARRAARGK